MNKKVKVYENLKDVECPQCGKAVYENGQTYCIHCHARVDEHAYNCPTCEEKYFITADYKFNYCGMCGKPIVFESVSL